MLSIVQYRLATSTSIPFTRNKTTPHSPLHLHLIRLLLKQRTNELVVVVVIRLRPLTIGAQRRQASRQGQRYKQ